MKATRSGLLRDHAQHAGQRGALIAIVAAFATRLHERWRRQPRLARSPRC